MPDVGKLPTAELRAGRGISLAWIAPALAVLFAGWLGYRTWVMRGLTITVQLDDGYGLRAGDELRYLGITVGQVTAVRLDEELDGIEVVARLDSASRGIARAGSRFWVVRPELGLDRVSGLETIVGPRYMAVRPGEGEPRTRFMGLAAPPPVLDVQPGDLEIVVEAAQRHGLRVGAPVLYRRIRVGTVLSAGLSSDGGFVESRLHVEARYAQLIRPGTVLWPIGGVRADLGLTGFSLELESLQALLVGGVALATPPGDAPPVHTGHRFRLAAEPPDGWLDWQPMAVIGSALLPAGVPLPTPLRATLGWRQGWLIKGRRSRQGWALATDAGLLGPDDLLLAGEDAEAGSEVLEVGGRTVRADRPAWRGAGLALLATSLDAPRWSGTAVRGTDAPEDCLVVADRSGQPVPLSASRLTIEADRWLVDEAVPLDESWHGASVLSRRDGRLIGVLMIDRDEDRAWIQPLPAELVERLGAQGT